MAYIRGTQKGDVYAFAIILYEIIGRRGPFGITGYEPKGENSLILLAWFSLKKNYCRHSRVS